MLPHIDAQSAPQPWVFAAHLQFLHRSMKFTSLPFFIVLTLSCAVAAGAEFAGARIFSSQMVLQQDASVLVWGTGDDGETVAVAFRGQTKTARVQNGEWRVALDPMPASADGHPLVLESGGSRITFEDVLVGEVWLASGQSNMQMRLKESVRGEESLARAADDRLRFFVTPANVRPGAAALPLEWNISSPDTAPQVSAVAYYFAEELRRATKIPIGIIQCAYGGSRAEAWCSPELLQKGWPQFERYKKNLTEEALKQHPQRRPSSCYEHMLKPLFPFAVRGTIWYQGESNAAHAVEHRRLLPAMIREFRTSKNLSASVWPARRGTTSTERRISSLPVRGLRRPSIPNVKPRSNSIFRRLGSRHSTGSPCAESTRQSQAGHSSRSIHGSKAIT